jgi:hypothetical protein
VVVDNGTVQTVVWTAPGPLAAPVYDTSSREPGLSENSMSLWATLAQFKELGKRIVLIWELGHCETRAIPSSVELIPDLGSVQCLD